MSHDEHLSSVIDSLFMTYDTDKNQTLEPAEIRMLLRDVFKKLGKSSCESDVNMFIESVDINKDGRISK